MSLKSVSLQLLKRRVFWTAPPASDPEVASDDPLALDYVAQQYGYELFGAFTTRTSRAQYYPMVLFGLNIAASRPSHAVPWSASELLDRFELWERVWALGVVEARGTSLEPADSDGFRGVRAAKRQWRSGSAPISLEFKLLSRQSELGALGAYLTSLRSVGLLTPGGYEPTPAAGELLDGFLKKADGRSQQPLVLLAELAIQERRLPRKRGGATLRTLGERTRLGAISERPDQQGRLWKVLFQDAKDDTLAIAQLLITDHRRRHTPFDSATFLQQAASGRLGAVSSSLRAKLEGARRLGAASRHLTAAFNSLYAYLANGEWMASEKDLGRYGLVEQQQKHLQTAARRLIAHDQTCDFLVKLPLHGQGLRRLLTSLATGRSDRQGDLILRFHEEVQRERGASAGWITRSHGQAYLSVTDYRGHEDASRFPTFKLPAVRQLLKDLGRLA